MADFYFKVVLNELMFDLNDCDNFLCDFRHGPYPLKYWAWYLIEPNVSLCLQGLNDIDK